MPAPVFTPLVVITNLGLAKIAAAVGGQAPPIVFTEMEVGNGQPDPDGYSLYSPTADQVQLVALRDTVAVSSVIVNGNNVEVAAYLDNTRGTYWISEVSVKDQDGDRLIFAIVPPMLKIADLASVMDVVLKVLVTISQAASVVIQTDPSAIFVDYALLLQALQEGSVKNILRGGLTMDPDQVLKDVTLPQSIDSSRSTLHVNFNHWEVHASVNTVFGYSVGLTSYILNQNTIRFERAPSGMGGNLNIRWEITEYGTSFVIPG